MIKYIIGTLIILWARLLNMKLFNNKQIIRTEAKVPWYRQIIWFYSNPTQILPNLYLGSAFNAYDIDQLNRINANVIINVTKEIDNFFESNLNFTYYKYPISDDNTEPIANILQNTYDKIDLHLERGDCVFVHCYMGASRSASVVINYLMKAKLQSYNYAYNFVKNVRPVVNLSELFATTLKYKYEHKLLI
jgi:atypical dual specificity phosphatase